MRNINRGREDLIEVIMKSHEETHGKGYRKRGLRIWCEDM
jgi:hypothetical protein